MIRINTKLLAIRMYCTILGHTQADQPLAAILLIAQRTRKTIFRKKNSRLKVLSFHCQLFINLIVTL